ncbi:MAG: hypothetical protein K2Y42_06540 [Hyphomicrobium sp.]|jgi:hypothetical protein|uniref:hypothetical protein n=1 Tax=Hyphomicrobium sp. TaxID=82 RepID=UPI0025BD140E|nr:hypothetical protein [Hyphomicrobium sp.]MBX9862396.1 hypothetical protein [Hyphomicrobium sp.]
MVDHIKAPHDPFERLSAYEKKLILSMAPSWSERYRMRNPRLTTQEREALLLTILLERRRLYERCFKQACAKSGVEPPTVRNLMSDDRLRSYQPLMNAALSETADQRMEDDKNDWTLRQAAENHRRDKLGLPPLTATDELENRNRRRKGKRMSL